jgi:peptidoglycan/xylan/chitin deacetylase (PgdA/CDA1 family)
MRTLALLAMLCALSAGEQPGDTRIATWQDDRTAVFLLMFDDGWPSHFQVAAPELHKRGMIATFYINPAKGEYAKFPKEWEKVRALGMVMANHTLTHQGATSPEAGVKEIEDCQKALQTLQPQPWPRLISFGMPGVKEWKLPPADHQAALARNHLIDRPTFNDHGAVYHLKTTAQMVALADKAIAAKGMEYLVIHGVERIVPDWKYQDFWALKQDVFLPLLDALKERADRGDLWITDHISWHKYQAERKAASVTVLANDARLIRLELTATTDPALYDLPLTLVTRVPAAWRQATVKQAASISTVPVADGCVRFRALPGGGPIELTP